MQNGRFINMNHNERAFFFAAPGTFLASQKPLEFTMAAAAVTDSEYAIGIDLGM